MWADHAGATILEHTKEAFPGLIVAGMAENAVAGEAHIGPSSAAYSFQEDVWQNW